MIHPRNPYHFTVAFLSLSSLFWLAACSPERPEWLGGDPKRPAADVVIGPKRTPLLNPRSGGYPAGNQGSETSGQPPPPGSPPPSLQNNPYDYFDNSGNPKPAPAPSSSEPTMFERWLGKDDQGRAAPTGNQHAARKQFPANPSYSGETVGIAPIPPGPQAAIISPAAGEPSAQPVMMEEPARPAASADMKPTQLPVQEMPAAQPLVADAPAPVTAPPPAVVMAEPAPAVAAVPQETAQASQPSWFDRMMSRVSGEPESPETQASKNMPYPELSSVPERPKEFNKLKASKETQMQDLEIEHAIAQEQRQMLGAEPSQLGAVPAPVPVAPAPATPENVTASPPPVAAPAPAPAPAGGPVLLGHAYDDRLSAPSSENTAVPVKETVAAPMPESYPAPSAPEKDASWWNRLNVFSKEKAKSPPADEYMSQQAPAESPPAQLADETAKEESATGDTAGLPPPTMLETVKTLPPSRYSDRARAMQLQTE